MANFNVSYVRNSITNARQTDEFFVRYEAMRIDGLIDIASNKAVVAETIPELERKLKTLMGMPEVKEEGKEDEDIS